MHIGYRWLMEHFALPDYPLPVSTLLGRQLQTRQHNGVTVRIVTSQYAPEPDPMAQLEFALKYEGINLPVLSEVFKAMGGGPLEDALRQTPSGKYTRLLGFYYEFCTGECLDPDIVVRGNYVPALDDADYVTAPGKNVTRWRVRNNLLGGSALCPMVRRLPDTPGHTDDSLQHVVKALVAAIPPGVLERAADYLYLKETKSTYRIEREEMPKQARMTRFLELLHSAGDDALEELLSEAGLTHRQNLIVDPRYAETGFRHLQNYVGETLRYREKIHYVCPPPEQVPSLINGLREMAALIAEVHPVIQAALVAFALVFIHPFEDGNGRLHRFLIHDILHRGGLTPPGLLLPVSATMLKSMREYDDALESFSRPLMNGLAVYEVDEAGYLHYSNGAALRDYYRFPDMTDVVSYLLRTVKLTIEEDFAEELQLIQCFDMARNRIRDVVDIPDRRLDLLLRYLFQNHGTLANRKRADFAELRDDELAGIETEFKMAFEGIFKP